MQNRPIFFSPSPLPNATFLEDPNNKWATSEAGQKALKWMAQIYYELSIEIAKDHGAEFLPQPPETILTGGLTDSIFQNGARGLYGQDYEKRDSTHMNADFGHKIIEQITHKLY